MSFAPGYALAHSLMKIWCSMSGAMMYLTSPPRAVTLALTSSVRATGEKMARDPDVSLTVGLRQSWCAPIVIFRLYSPTG